MAIMCRTSLNTRLVPIRCLPTTGPLLHRRPRPVIHPTMNLPHSNSPFLTVTMTAQLMLMPRAISMAILIFRIWDFSRTDGLRRGNDSSAVKSKRRWNCRRDFETWALDQSYYAYAPFQTMPIPLKANFKNPIRLTTTFTEVSCFARLTSPTTLGRTSTKMFLRRYLPKRSNMFTQFPCFGFSRRSATCSIINT